MKCIQEQSKNKLFCQKKKNWKWWLYTVCLDKVYELNKLIVILSLDIYSTDCPITYSQLFEITHFLPNDFPSALQTQVTNVQKVGAEI